MIFLTANGYICVPVAPAPGWPTKQRLLQSKPQVEGKLLGFYRLDIGEKLLLPDELAQALRQESTARQAAEQRAEFAEQRAESAEQQLAQERQQREALLQRLQERGINLEDLKPVNRSTSPYPCILHTPQPIPLMALWNMGLNKDI